MFQGLLSSSNAASLFSSIGGIVQGIGGFFQARQETAMGNYNAAVYEQQAQATRTSGALLEMQKRRMIKSTMGTQKAMVAKSGLKNTGSALDVQLDSLTNAELDLAIDRYNTEVKARGYGSAAAMEKYEAKQRSARAYSSASSSFLKTAADLYKSQREIGGGKEVWSEKY